MVAALRSLGIRKGDRLLVQSRNTLAMFESCWVAFRLGAVWVPVNFRLTPPEVAYLGASSGAVAMLVDEGFDAHVAAVREASPALRVVIPMGGGKAGELNWEALVAVASRRRAVRGAGRGRRSAVVLLHLGHDRPAQGRHADARPDGLHRHQPPGRPDPGHDRARRVDRGRAAVARRGHPRAAQRRARRGHGAAAEREARSGGVLAAGRTPSREQPVHGADHRQDAGRTSGGRRARPLVAALHDLRRRADVPRRPAARAAHAGPGAGAVLRPRRGDGLHHGADAVPCTRPTTTRRTPTSARAGVRAPAWRWRSSTRTCVAWPSARSARSAAAGPGVFAGYHDNAEATAKALRGGWFHTGDLGRVDARGLLYITGRESDMYISGGSNVYPREVEEVLLTHPAVAEVAVLGMPDEKWGEVGVAVVVARDGVACDAAALLGAPRRPLRALPLAAPRVLLGRAAQVRLRQGDQEGRPRTTLRARRIVGIHRVGEDEGILARLSPHNHRHSRFATPREGARDDKITDNNGDNDMQTFPPPDPRRRRRHASRCPRSARSRRRPSSRTSTRTTCRSRTR